MKTTYVYIGIVVLVVAGLMLARNSSEGTASRVTAYDGFAECLGQAGAQFFGAWWCPHCTEQKELFDMSSKLPYVECSTPDGKGQKQECIDEKVTGYPTWKFADGSTVDRVMQLSELAEKTSCSLPTP